MLFYPIERHKLLFPCCAPELLSNAQVRTNSVLWFLNTEKAVAYFCWGMVPSDQTETIQGATWRLPSISTAALLSVPNTFKFAYFSNLLSPPLVTRLFILWSSSLLLTFPHNAHSLKYFKLTYCLSHWAHHVFPYDTFLILITEFQAVCTLYSIKNSIPPKVVTIRRLQLSGGCSVGDIFTYSLC